MNMNHDRRHSIDINNIKPDFKGLAHPDIAQAAARNILNQYDTLGEGTIDVLHIMPMLIDVYKHFDVTFKPSRKDLTAFFKHIDQDGNEQIDITDLNTLCLKYLTPQAPKVYGKKNKK